MYRHEHHLEDYNLEIGLLINFGETRLKFHRLKNKKACDWIGLCKNMIKY